MIRPPDNIQTITIDLLPNYIALQRTGDWVNIQLKLPDINVQYVTNAVLEFTGGSSTDTLEQTSCLSVFNTDRTDVVIPLGNVHSVVTDSFGLDNSFAELLLDKENTLSIRTSGTAGSWLVVEQLKLIITANQVLRPVVPMPHNPSNRYRGNKEGGKFLRYAHEVAGACTDILINKKEVPVSETSLMSVSTELQHLRRILDWRIR